MTTNINYDSKEIFGAEIQYFRTDPVSLIQEGTSAQIAADVVECRKQAGGRVTVSAGCEITPGTSEKNMRAFRKAAVVS